MVPALLLTAGDEMFTFDDDELVTLHELSFLFGSQGGTIGRLLVAKVTLSEREVRTLATFAHVVRGQLGSPLVVYDHGRGSGTVCFQHKPWYELVKRSGLRYQKPTARYVKGEKGKLESVDDVTYVRGRSVRDPAATAQTLGDLPAVASAVEKLERVLVRADAGAAVTSAPRQTYEYF